MERMWDAIVDRQNGFINFDARTHEAFATTKVAVIGTGGNGSVLDLLVRTGFTRFVLIDPDHVESTNLNRLPFYPEDAGIAKVEVWKTHLCRINPECTVEGHHRGITRYDGPWLKSILADARILFLGTTEPEANLVAGRIAAQLGLRMIIGPASSGSAVVSTFTHDNGLTVEKLGDFGTEGIPLEKIDYSTLAGRHFAAMAFPGRSRNYRPDVWAGMREGTCAARSAGIFVRLTNAVMAFEGVKNAIVLHGLPLEGTSVVAVPEVQIFDPRTGSAYRYNVLTKQISVPDLLPV